MNNTLLPRQPWALWAINDDETRFLQSMTELAYYISPNARHAVEIGTGSGWSTAHIAQRLPVDTYDTHEAFIPSPEHRTGDFARYHERDKGMYKIKFHRGDSSEAAKNVDATDDVPSLIFIDADHCNPWPAKDFINMAFCCHPESVFVFHDIALDMYPNNEACNGARWLWQWLGEAGATRILPATNERMPNIGAAIFTRLSKCTVSDAVKFVQAKLPA